MANNLSGKNRQVMVGCVSYTQMDRTACTDPDLHLLALGSSEHVGYLKPNVRCGSQIRGKYFDQSSAPAERLRGG